MFLFYKTNQLGLLYGSIGGLIINLLGLYQWTQKEIKLNKNIRKTMLLIVYLFFGVSIYNIFLFINEPNLKIAEWIGSIFGLCGALLLAARFKYSFLCWFAWIISNGILIITTLQTKQYGVFSLQLGFMVLNIYGVIYWFKNYKKLI